MPDLALDEKLAAQFLKLLDQAVHKVSVLGVPLCRVEVAGHPFIALVVCLEPAGPDAAPVPDEELWNPGATHIRLVSRDGYVLHLRVSGLAFRGEVKSPRIHISTAVLCRGIDVSVSRETMRLQFPKKRETGVCAGVEAGEFRGFQDLLY